jgi:hypothetical protein
MNVNDTSFRPAEGDPPKPPAEATSIRSAENMPPKEPGPKSLPAGLEQTVFLSRLRRLLELHKDMFASKSKPQMWGMIQFGCIVVAALVAWKASQAVGEAEGSENMTALTFFVTFFAIAGLPDVMLYFARRIQRTNARQTLEEYLVSTMQSFPTEVEQCGGVSVLADRVELEALIQVLENRAAPEGPEGKAV